MIITNIEETTGKKLVNGTLPDIDSDFAGKDRPAIKSYMEKRFGAKQVCSVGTFTTMKLKGLVKDLSRTANVDFAEANLITSIIDFKDESMTDLIRRAAGEPKLKHFIQNNSDLFHMLPTLLDQQKALSIHPCAMIIFPDVMSSQEWVPVRRQQGLVVSEWGGNEMDEAGFLKEDILGIKQLDKFAKVLELIELNGKEVPNIYDLPHDNEVYRYFSNGWNGDVFQMGSSGLTEYTKALKPETIDDLIAANALYRPGPMENHYHEIYVKCKNEGRAPKYLWGTEEITRDTYGLVIYQEQILKIFQEIGGLTMMESDDVRRAIGKKKIEPLMKWKEVAFKGFEGKGATRKQYNEVWDAILEFAKYGFNKSHSAAYALTGYVCQWLKVNYPIEYWTTSLDYADEERTLIFLSEIMQAGVISIKAPDINKSDIVMTSDMNESTIFWGIASIKGIGEATAEQIVKDKNERGPYTSFADFYIRHNFKGSKVKKQTYEALIASGAFDLLYGFSDNEHKRLSLINRFRKVKKVKIANPQRDVYTIGQTHEKWFWQKQQKALTGLAIVNYKEIAEENDILSEYCTPIEFARPQDKPLIRSFGGYITEVRIKRGAKGRFALVTVENNYKLFKVIFWNDQFLEWEDELKGSEKSFIIFDANLKYESKWSKANQFTIREDSKVVVLK